MGCFVSILLAALGFGLFFFGSAGVLGGGGVAIGVILLIASSLVAMAQNAADEKKEIERQRWTSGSGRGSDGIGTSHGPR